jgi:hypothetical protein
VRHGGPSPPYRKTVRTVLIGTEAAVPKLVHSTPKYCKHRSSGQTVVTINGRDVYLGPHGTATSRREYDRVIAEWLANGRRSAFDGAADLFVVELIASCWRHAQKELLRRVDGGRPAVRSMRNSRTWEDRIFAA